MERAAPVPPRSEPLADALDRPPFSFLMPASRVDASRFVAEDISFRPADDEHWASLRFRVAVPDAAPGMEFIVKEWVNDWWPPPCPDLPLRTRGTVRFIPTCADTPAPPRAAWWVVGADYHGSQGVTAHLAGTNVEVRIPDGLDATDPLVAEFASSFSVIARGPPSWIARSYHARRDIPDRGWGDGVVTGLAWAPFDAAPEHPECPAPDLLVNARLPAHAVADATGFRTNPRIGHFERQWVVVDGRDGAPLVWARAVPFQTRHRHPLVARGDARYRLDWEETPVGWAGSLDAAHGHHVVLLERPPYRIEVWVGLHAGLDRRGAAVLADRLFA